MKMKFPRLPTKALCRLIRHPSSPSRPKPSNYPKAVVARLPAPEILKLESPRLPWEVLERIISYCGDVLDTLCSLSLTCRQLRPRSQGVIFARVDLTRSKDRRVFLFVAFLEASANPNLEPLVLSVAVRPIDFGPSLLYLLPNLSAIECLSSGPSEASVLPLHHTSLACFRRLGTHVQTLHLVNISFSTSLAFTQVLLALGSIAHLVCTEVVIKTEGKGPLDVAKRRLSERLRLRSLAVSISQLVNANAAQLWIRYWQIDSQSLTGGDRDASVGALLFNSELAPSTLESLRLIRSTCLRHYSSSPLLFVQPLTRLVAVPGSDTFLYRSTWPRLSSLVLQLPYDYEVIANAAEFLENFRGPKLKEVALELGPVQSVMDITRDDLSAYNGETEPRSGVHSRLERILLNFSLPRITWIINTPLRAGRNAFWTREFGKHFPVLFRQGALVLKSPTGGFALFSLLLR